MNWIILSHAAQLEELVKRSREKPQVIFKHSTRCSISGTAKSRLERAGSNPAADFFYLDLLSHRDISNAIAEQFRVQHASPQVLVIKNGKCVYDESHLAIRMEDILEQAAA